MTPIYVTLCLYRDRPEDEWPRAADGSLAMVNAPLDIPALLAEAD